MTYNVFVHAFEHVNPGLEAGGDGFDWYPDEPTAREKFSTGNYPLDVIHPNYTADFFFTFATAHNPNGDEETRQKITDEIDGLLHELTAEAKERRVGANVVWYWRENGMKMGDTTRTASEVVQDRDNIPHEVTFTFQVKAATANEASEQVFTAMDKASEILDANGILSFENTSR